MKKNPRVIGVKNSSMPTQDIQMWRDEGLIVFNGPDEQFISGLTVGRLAAHGLIVLGLINAHGTIHLDWRDGARVIQNEICRIIYAMCAAHGNLYAVMKAILKKWGADAGTVRKPRTP